MPDVRRAMESQQPQEPMEVNWNDAGVNENREAILRCCRCAGTHTPPPSKGHGSGGDDTG